MRHIIQNYKHYPGYHCGSSGLRNLLSYCGCNISEDMVIGLGEAPSFYYFSDRSFDPVKIIHTRFGFFEETFIKNTGLPFMIESGLENTESWLAVKDYIRGDIPVMVRTDIFYLPYFNSKVHFNGHIVVVWGFDEENNEAYLSDTLRPEAQTVSITDLILARASETPPYMEKNIIFTVGERINKSDIDIVRVAIPAIRSWGERHIMSGVGIQSLKNLREDLPTWEDVESRSWCERFAYQQIEKRGTGGAAFRMPYLGFLKELRAYIKDASLDEVIGLFSKNVKSWHRFAALFKEKSEGNLKDYLDITAWKEALAGHEMALDNIKAIYLTHYHPDHFGCAGWLQKPSGASVFISSTDEKRAKRVWLNYRGGDDIYSAFFLRCGLPPQKISEIVNHMQLILPFVQPYPELKTVEEGELITLGDDRYVAIHTPGHSDGHLCFYCKENGVMFSGDHLLPHITSNISLWPGAASDPLSDYLSSLKKVKTLNSKLVLPAHGSSFTNAGERVSELEEHHHQRLKKILSLARSGATAYEICLRLFGEDLPLQEKRFALGETLAHLVYLQRRCKLECRARNGVTYYSN